MSVTISQGYLGAVYMSPPGWTPQALSDEPMNEVDLTAEGRPRYTVYEITNPAKRYVDDDTPPVFTSSIAGVLAPYKIEHPGCRIYLTTALGGAETVVCTSGNYVPVTMVQGVTDYNFAGKWKTSEKRFLRDSATRNLMIEKGWECTVNLASANTCAFLTTALTGDNNDITWEHGPGGTAGNDYSIEYVDPGGETATLGITVTVNAIVVNLGRTASAIDTTANAIVGLASANAILQERKITAKLAGALGTGLVTELAHTHLAGGLDPYDYPGMAGKCVAVFYENLDNDGGRWEDFAMIPTGSLKIDPNDMIAKTITLRQYGGANSGPFFRSS